MVYKRSFFGLMNHLNGWLFKHRLHFFLWIVYIIYESVIIGLISGQFGGITNYLIHYSMNISLFYFHFALLNLIGFANKKFDYLKIFISVFFEICVYLFLLALLNHFFTVYNQGTGWNFLGIDKGFILKATYRSLFFIIFSTGYWAIKRFLKSRKDLEQKEKDSYRATIERDAIQKDLILSQNAYLRAQLSPHLIFNSLSFVHNRLIKVDDIAGEMILALSEMMRYAIDTNIKREWVFIHEELEQLENLVYIFNILHNNLLNFEFECDREARDVKIIPLVLITLMENMYKHGNLGDPKSVARFEIRLRNHKLFIITINKISGNSSKLSLGIGLENLSERLLKAYGQRAKLKWTKTDTFSLELEIENAD